MKKSLFFTIGVILILIVLGVWMYLLFFGTPDASDDVFTNLGIGSSGVPTSVNEENALPQQDEASARIETGGGLQQLTTRPVAGFGFMGSSSSRLRYVERGTGHVYELDTDSGNERRVSGTTIPRVVHAEFSQSGENVALVSEEGNTRTTLVGTIDEEAGGTEYVSLPNNVFDAKFTNDSVLNYALPTSDGSVGYEYDITLGEPVQVFSIPLRDITVVWDEPPFVYNNPTRHFKGSLYRVGANLAAVTPGEFGYVGGISDSFIYGTYVEEDILKSYTILRGTVAQSLIPITYLPEKCSIVPVNSALLWCASPSSVQNGDYIENWYKGTQTSEDMLWLIDVTASEASLFSDFFSESGRIVDVDSLVSDFAGKAPLFRNKIDNTLWMYDARNE